MTEQGREDNAEYIGDCHDKPDHGCAADKILEDEGDEAVIKAPGNRTGEKSESDQECLLVIQFHVISP
jgi:hypothetical protein